MKTLGAMALLGGLVSCSPETVTVRGDGSASIKPDYATVSASVESNSDSSVGAVEDATSRAGKIKQGLVKFGLNADEIAIRSFEVTKNCDEKAKGVVAYPVDSG